MNLKDESGLPASGMRLSSPGLGLMILSASFVFFLIMIPVLTGLLAKTGMKVEAVVRISMMAQDILVFIVPAIAAAMLSTRLPAKLLCVDRWTDGRMFVVAVLVLFSSMPAMNLIVEWNSNWRLPESMGALEAALRAMEEAAEETVKMLMSGASVGSLIVSILIIGVLAGLSEELFFRGAMQRILMCTRLNGHVVVWTVAFVFSLLHFQFFGFVPRMLLGAYFGYLLWWSRSLWLPIMLHALNNSLVVFFAWREANGGDTGLDVDKIGTDMSSVSEMAMVCVSVVATAGLLAWLYKLGKERTSKYLG